MNITHDKRGPHNRHPHRNHLLTALLVAAMVMILSVPAFATDVTGTTSEPGTEVSASTPDLAETPADEADPTPAPTSGPVTTIEELLDAIANANENDVIEFAGEIRTPSESVIGRADCPITIRRATDDACLVLGSTLGGNVRVENITFDGAEIQSVHTLVYGVSPMQTIEKCNFVNCISEYGSALCVAYGDAYISDCHFDNNKGLSGAHLRLEGSNATVENCTFTGGYASDSGSIFLGTTANLTGCTISRNAAGEQGGGICISRGSVRIDGSKIYGNTTNGVADDITKSYLAYLSLMDDYAALVELYKSDGVVPNKWSVDSRVILNSGMEPDCANMVFSMTFADNEPSLPPVSYPTAVTLDKSELTLDVGETDTLTATLYPEGTNSSVQWTSSDPSVASVGEGGFITAHSTGTAVITATATDGGASASCRVNVQAVPATTYPISVSASPVNGGMVNGNGQYEEGATATVTAVPNENFRFLAWAEADTQISTEACFTFTVTSDRTLTAIFEPISEPTPGPIPKPTYTITTSATVGGTVSGAGTYEQGSSVTLTATPENGYLFVGWTENNEQISTDESFTFIVDRDRTLAANFVPITQSTYTINVSATAGGTASGEGEYEEGSSVTLIATPESEYLFIGWTENGEQVSSDESFTFVVEQDRTFVANFEPISNPTYTVQVISTQGGTVEGGGSYEKGTFIMVNAVPDNGYRFLYWEENGEQVSPVANVTFMVIRNRTLVAVFEPIPKPVYTIQVNSTQGGGVDGGGSYTEGESVTVTATSDAGYRFLRWEENGVQVSTEARFSFTAEADRTLVAVFDLIPQSVPNSTYEPPHNPGTPSTSYRPSGNNVQPTITSLSTQKAVQIPTLTKGKAVLTAPDDLFWVGYKAGQDNGTKTITRADLAQLVYSMMDNESRKIYGVTQSPFRDVEHGAWYEAAVGAMLDTGIMVGCGNDLFCPDRTLTWGELLTVFARFAENKPSTEYYTGAHWAKNSVNKAFTLGWLEYSETFNPGKIVTTGEMADLIQAVFRWSIE